MRLFSYRRREEERLAAQVGQDRVVDLLEAADRSRSPMRHHFVSMLALIRGGDDALAQARELVGSCAAADTLPLAGLPLLAPLPLPEQIRDFANYELHVRQAIASSLRLRSMAEPDPKAALARFEASGMHLIPPVWYQRPLYYKANRFSVVGHEAEVEWPSYSARMDYELELAVVIGKRVRDLAEDEAMDAVFGYTIYNDFSARDTQSQETSFRMGPAKGKDFDTGNAIGPCIVTRDEIPDPAALEMSVRVNGELRNRTSSAGMQHGIARCISYLSQSETLHPGEILAMGTVGNGCGYESLTFLADGDVVELEVQGIGTLRNRLVRQRRSAT